MKARFKDYILFEDEHYLVINKPSGLSTLSDRKQPASVLDWSRHYWPHCQVCHRLDKETSGALVLAKDPSAYRHLSLQFQNRTVHKEYHAVVEGRHNFQDRKVELDLAMGRRGMVHVATPGKPSQTVFNTLDIYKAHSLISCRPITGRTHQIRVHLSHLGAPIVGDANYGGRPFYLSQIKHRYNLKKYTEERPLMSRLALHAINLRFQLLNGDYQQIEAAYPKDFRVLIQQLDKNRPTPNI